MIVVAGPRIDPASLNAPDGVEVRAFVPNLDRHLAACDLALVQGGLTTCMELTAAGTPFLYFPLKNHFEQNFHVAHRLDRYGAGRRMEFATSTPDTPMRWSMRCARRPNSNPSTPTAPPVPPACWRISSDQNQFSPEELVRCRT
ncbi:MAG TPA: glycosyltransferase [Bradyrhizobium sp.]|nr:glycosyltransferase [Bradyrhizobium sp.]